MNGPDVAKQQKSTETGQRARSNKPSRGNSNAPSSRGGRVSSSRGGRGNNNRVPSGRKRQDNNTDADQNFKNSTSNNNKNSNKAFSSNTNGNGNNLSGAFSFNSDMTQSKIVPPSNALQAVGANVQNFSGIESQYVGSFMCNPENDGYQRLPRKAIPTPKYLLKEQVQFETETFSPNQWDVQNQQKLLQMEAQYQGDPQTLFEQFQEMRNEERKMMESLNLVDVENAKKSLSDALIFKGTCVDMCPTYERVERTFKNQVSKWERDPTTKLISRQFAIKTFIRPSGQAPSLPSDVRPPHILVKTLDYIIENLLVKLPESQSFIWDRTRSIRQDFTFQNNYSGPEAVECHEKICRIHLLSLHYMAGVNDPDYQQQQELEQFINSLQTLTHMYNDVRSRSGKCPNEAEFRAYELLSNLKDTEMDRNIQQLPADIFQNDIVQRAIMLRGMVTQQKSAPIGNFNNYIEFFKVINDPQTPFLLACLAESHFNEIRFNALKLISVSSHSKAVSPTCEYFSQRLGFDTPQDFLRTVEFYKIPTTMEGDGSIKVDLTAFKSKTYQSSQKQAYTASIDAKIANKSMQDVVHSGIPNGPFGITPLNQKNSMNLENIVRETRNTQNTNNGLIEKVLNSSNTGMKPTHFGISAGSNPTAPAFQFNVPSSQTLPTSIGSASQFIHPQAIAQPQVVPEAPKKVPVTQLPGYDAVVNGILNGMITELTQKAKAKIVKVTVDNELSRRKQEAAAKIKQEEQLKKQREIEAQQRKIEQQRQLEQQRMKLQRSQKIEVLSQELLGAFLEDQIYVSMLEIFASSYREKKLKKFAVGRISKKSKLSYEKLVNKKRKLTEIDQYINSIGASSTSKKQRRILRNDSDKQRFMRMFKPLNSSNPGSANSSMVSNTSTASDMVINASVEPSHQLKVDTTAPIDFKEILSNMFPITSSSKLIPMQMNLLLVSQDHGSETSEWLSLKKFGLKYESQLKSYFKLVRHSNKKLLVSLLPEHVEKPIHWFKNQNIIMFEVTIDHINENCVKKFKEVFIYVKKYSRRKVNFLVMVFNPLKVDNKKNEVLKQLTDIYTSELESSSDSKVGQLKTIDLSDFCFHNFSSAHTILKAGLVDIFETMNLNSRDIHSNSLLDFNNSTLTSLPEVDSTSVSRIQTPSSNKSYSNLSSITRDANVTSEAGVGNTTSVLNFKNAKKREKRKEYVLSQLALNNNLTNNLNMVSRSRFSSTSTVSSGDRGASQSVSATTSAANEKVPESRPTSGRSLMQELEDLKKLTKSIRSRSSSVYTDNADDSSASINTSVNTSSAGNQSFNDSLLEIKQLIKDVLRK